MKMPVISWFLTPSADLESVSALQRMGYCLFLAVTGFLFIYYVTGAKRLWILGGYTLTMVFTISRSILAIPLVTRIAENYGWP